MDLDGGVAHWLVRRSLAGGLSLIWLTCDHFVGKVSAIIVQPGQLSLLSLQGQ